MSIQKSGAWSLMFAAVTIGFSPPPIHGQEGEFCGEILVSPCYSTYHWHDGSGEGFEPMHFDCRLCVGGVGCHYICGEETDMDYVAVLEAGANGNRDVLLKYAEAGSEFIAFNEERQALVILDCSRTALVAHLPLASEKVRVASQLVRSGTLKTTRSWIASISSPTYQPDKRRGHPK